MISLKTAKKALAEAMPKRKGIEKARSACADAGAEVEIAFGTESNPATELRLAELKLRGARELIDQSVSHLINAVSHLSGLAPDEGAQIELFSLDDGGWRIVINGEGMPAPTAEETPLEKAIAEAESPRSPDGSINGKAEDVVKGTIGAAAAEKTPEQEELDKQWAEDRERAEELFPKLSEKHHKLLALFSGPATITSESKALKGLKNPLRGLVTRKAVHETGGNFTLSPLGWELNSIMLEQKSEEKARDEAADEAAIEEAEANTPAEAVA